MEYYKDFYETLTGYRKSILLILASEIELGEIIGEGIETSRLFEDTGFNPSVFSRLIMAFTELGLIVKEKDYIYLTPFSKKFLCRKSAFNQLGTLKFEKKILENWLNPLGFLKSGGSRSFPVKSRTDYLKDLNCFIKSMDEAANIRSEELWEKIPVHQKNGIIADFGAGSGAALKSFLSINRNWKGIFLDLQDVVEIAKEGKSLKRYAKRIKFYGINLLEEKPLIEDKVDIVLFSNFLHCQSYEENLKIIERASGILKPEGKIIVQDFIPNLCPSGYLYDIHMMLNTINGRTYTLSELNSLCNEAGLEISETRLLTSGSGYIIASPLSPSQEQ